jgi:hypothetical protein
MARRMASRALAMVMRHRLRGKVALVHALCAILARSPAVFVHALGLALSAADAGATRSERC